MATKWVGSDPDFVAVSQRNKANRGSEGTHSAGSLNFFRFKERLVCIYMERHAFIFPSSFYLVHITFLFAMQDSISGRVSTGLQPWRKMKQKQQDQSLPRPHNKPGYYGTAEEDLTRYSATLKGLRPEVEDAESQEVNQRAMVLSGHGRPPGRNRILHNVVEPTMSFTQAKATLPESSSIVPPRRQPRRSTSTDVSLSHFHPLTDIRSCIAKICFNLDEIYYFRNCSLILMQPTLLPMRSLSPAMMSGVRDMRPSNCINSGSVKYVSTFTSKQYHKSQFISLNLFFLQCLTSTQSCSR